MVGLFRTVPNFQKRLNVIWTIKYVYIEFKTSNIWSSTSVKDVIELWYKFFKVRGTAMKLVSSRMRETFQHQEILWAFSMGDHWYKTSSRPLDVHHEEHQTAYCKKIQQDSAAQRTSPGTKIRSGWTQVKNDLELFTLGMRNICATLPRTIVQGHESRKPNSDWGLRKTLNRMSKIFGIIMALKGKENMVSAVYTPSV